MLHDVLDKKEVFLDYLLVTHDFGQKFQFFVIYFFLEIKPEYVQSAVLDKKDALLFYKTVHFSKSQTRNFSKGVNPFFLSRIS